MGFTTLQAISPTLFLLTNFPHPLAEHINYSTNKMYVGSLVGHAAAKFYVNVSELDILDHVFISLYNY